MGCVGIADRACFDLNAHATAAKCDLRYRQKLDKEIETTVLSLTKPAGIAVMKAFKKQGRAVKEWLEQLPEDELRCLVSEVEKDKKATRTADLSDGPLECTFLPEHVVCETKKEKQSTITFMPSVVEPAFGIDRILFSTLEHSYYARAKDANSEDKQTRGVLKFTANIAPYKLTILPQDQRITRDDKCTELVALIRNKVSSLGHSTTIDDSNATLGKRYARNDELGIPFACTIDFTSMQDSTVTLRERDSMQQIRLNAAEVGPLLHDLCTGKTCWDDAQKKYPAQ